MATHSSFDFVRDVIQRSESVPVLVDFWAEWCGPCRVLTPVLERVAAKLAGRVELVKVNIDDEPEIAQQLMISAVPSVKLFHRGRVQAEFMGALPEHEVTRWLEQVLPSPAADTLTTAKAALKAGDRGAAEEALTSAIATDPEAWEAHVLLAELLLRRDPTRALALVDKVPVNDPLADRVEGVRTLAALKEAVARGVPSEAASGPAAADWLRYLEGARAFVDERDADALEAWIDLVRRRRQLADDGPRRAAVALLRARGDDDELAREYRRKLTSALF